MSPSLLLLVVVSTALCAAPGTRAMFAEEAGQHDWFAYPSLCFGDFYYFNKKNLTLPCDEFRRQAFVGPPAFLAYDQTFGTMLGATNDGVIAALNPTSGALRSLFFFF